MKLKELREQVDAIGSIDNAAKLKEAIPLYVEGKHAIDTFLKTIQEVAKVMGRLNDKMSAYALKHPTVFDDGKLSVDPKGVMRGDITMDDGVYHFASGYGTPVRDGGEPMTQSFLSALPKGWAKAVLKLDTTWINREYGNTPELCEALCKQGLVRPVKNDWSVKFDNSNVDAFDE